MAGEELGFDGVLVGLLAIGHRGSFIDGPPLDEGRRGGCGYAEGVAKKPLSSKGHGDTMGVKTLLKPGREVGKGYETANTCEAAIM